jgi:hypothetical protein
MMEPLGALTLPSAMYSTQQRGWVQEGAILGPQGRMAERGAEAQEPCFHFSGPKAPQWSLTGSKCPRLSARGLSQGCGSCSLG